MKVTYKEKDVFESSTFLTPGLGETIVSVGPDNDSLKLVLDFIESKEKEQKFEFHPIDNKSLKISLINWNNALGTSFSEPIEIGTLFHRKLFLMLLVRKVGGEGQTREINITTYLGEGVQDGEN